MRERPQTEIKAKKKRKKKKKQDMAHITSAPNGLDAKSELVPIFMTFDLFSLPQFYPQRKTRKKRNQTVIRHIIHIEKLLMQEEEG
jgi:hypothetical protein